MPEHVLMSEIEIITDGGRRRRWSAAEKLRIVERDVKLPGSPVRWRFQVAASREALAAATTTAADVLDMENEIGRIAPGYSADIIAVDATARARDGEPLERLIALRDRADRLAGAW